MAKAKRSKKLKVDKPVLDERAELDALGPVADYPEGRIAWFRARCAIMDRYRKRSRMSDPEKLQERHSPTVEISVDDPEATRKARRNLTRVRQSEAWRHNQLDGKQKDAEAEMELAWRANTAGMGAAVSKYSPLGAKGDGGIELGAEIAQTWRDWHERAKPWVIGPADIRQIVPAVVIDLLSQPKTLADIERDHRLKPGEAMACYIRGLDLWCELRGWSNSRGTIADSRDNSIRTWVAK